MYVLRNTEARSCNHFGSGKEITIICSECVFVDLYIYSVKCACALLSPLARPAPQYFSQFFYKRHDFRKKKRLLNSNRSFLFSLRDLSETFLILTGIRRDMVINVNWC
jgi:hypothetical protein